MSLRSIPTTGSQYTSRAFTGRLREHRVAASMDGRGRYLDNIFIERLWRSYKTEEIYLKDYGNVPDLSELPKMCTNSRQNRH